MLWSCWFISYPLLSLVEFPVLICHCWDESWHQLLSIGFPGHCSSIVISTMTWSAKTSKCQSWTITTITNPNESVIFHKYRVLKLSNPTNSFNSLWLVTHCKKYIVFQIKYFLGSILLLEILSCQLQWVVISSPWRPPLKMVMSAWLLMGDFCGCSKWQREWVQKTLSRDSWMLPWTLSFLLKDRKHLETFALPRFWTALPHTCGLVELLRLRPWWLQH